MNSTTWTRIGGPTCIRTGPTPTPSSIRKDDGNLIISIRHQNWLVKIDYNNGAGAGDILWHLGYQGDFASIECRRHA